MGTVHTFTPRPRRAAGVDVRAQIEAAAQAAIGHADHLIALLDQMDGDELLQDGHDAERSFSLPEDCGSQIVRLCDSDTAHEVGLRGLHDGIIEGIGAALQKHDHPPVDALRAGGKRGE